MNYEVFITEFKKDSNIDLKLYKEAQMRRRIESFMTKHIGSIDYKLFIKNLREDKDLFEKFKDHITINLTYFFRNPEVWEDFKTKIIPKILEDKKSKNLKIWSAGCSSGEEPYTISMIMKEYFPDVKVKIIATDIDKKVLEKCKKAIYEEKSFDYMDKKMKDKYFTQVHNDDSRVFGNLYEIDKKLKDPIEFKSHNMLYDSFPSDVDILICRNVVIYFTEETKAELYKKFHNSLNEHGFLLVGNTEHILKHRELGYESYIRYFFKKNKER